MLNEPKTNNYIEILKYIENYWDLAQDQRVGSARNLIMRFGRISLPNPIISPNNTYFAGSQYYWDTYFTILGLIAAGRLGLARSMVDNLCYLYERFGLMPARNSWTSIGRTQPPFLTGMAYAVYESGGADEVWLEKIMTIAADEYEKVWCSSKRLDGSTGLSHYHPRYFPKQLTVFESGWDMSTRFVDKGQVIPIDLNCLLFQYEQDLEKWAKQKGDSANAVLWGKRAQARRGMINKFLWDDQKGYFYDYELGNNRRSNLMTLAGYYPLWCGLATKKQAQTCRKRLKVFEQRYGLASTEKLAWHGRQWDYPNGWPPLQLVVTDGLRRYGCEDDAKRLTRKWLNLNCLVFQQTGKLWEKYDVVSGGVGLKGRYPTQAGFGWTNAVFLKLYGY